MAMIFASLHGISAGELDADALEKANESSKKTNEFINKFGAKYRLRHFPKTRDFCPTRTTLMVAHCLLWATHSLPLFLMRLRNFIIKARLAKRFMVRIWRTKRRNFQQIFENWIVSEEKQRKSVQAKMYKHGHMHKNEVRANIPNYAKLHSTDVEKQQAILDLYNEKRDAFRKKFRGWFEHMVLLRNERDLLKRKCSQKDVPPLPEWEIHLENVEKELGQWMKTQPRFAYTVHTVPVTELIAKFAQTMCPSAQTPATLVRPSFATGLMSVGVSAISTSTEMRPMSPSKSNLLDDVASSPTHEHPPGNVELPRPGSRRALLASRGSSFTRKPSHEPLGEGPVVAPPRAMSQSPPPQLPVSSTSPLRKSPNPAIPTAGRLNMIKKKPPSLAAIQSNLVMTNQFGEPPVALGANSPSSPITSPLNSNNRPILPPSSSQSTVLSPTKVLAGQKPTFEPTDHAQPRKLSSNALHQLSSPTRARPLIPPRHLPSSHPPGHGNEHTSPEFPPLGGGHASSGSRSPYPDELSPKQLGSLSPDFPQRKRVLTPLSSSIK